MSLPVPARRRGAAATRQAILDAARIAFARAGYDGAGVREIAAAAGVTAMLVNRYFGSKEALFAEVVAAIMAGPRILTEDLVRSPSAGAQLATAVVAMTATGATPLDGFLIMIHSASSARAAEIGRAQIEAHHQRDVAAALPGDNAPQRAALILSLISGFQVMRQVIGLSALTAADPRTLADVLGPVLQMLIDGQSPENLTSRDGPLAGDA